MMVKEFVYCKNIGKERQLRNLIKNYIHFRLILCPNMSFPVPGLHFRHVLRYVILQRAVDSKISKSQVTDVRIMFLIR